MCCCLFPLLGSTKQGAATYCSANRHQAASKTLSFQDNQISLEYSFTIPSVCRVGQKMPRNVFPLPLRKAGSAGSEGRECHSRNVPRQNRSTPAASGPKPAASSSFQAVQMWGTHPKLPGCPQGCLRRPAGNVVHQEVCKKGGWRGPSARTEMKRRSEAKKGSWKPYRPLVPKSRRGVR